ncbi:MAG: hypothetical protein JOZ12_07710, partial [Sinobacteraceae bacterium]|nr:hypothetical protein [Nevskiaceae bacterium]
HAPTLVGLYGTTVPLADGSFALVDEHYVRDSILDPGAQIAAGFDNLMPSYAGRLSEEQLLELIEYVKSLGGRPGGEGP